MQCKTKLPRAVKKFRVLELDQNPDRTRTLLDQVYPSKVSRLNRERRRARTTIPPAPTKFQQKLTTNVTLHDNPPTHIQTAVAQSHLPDNPQPALLAPSILYIQTPTPSPQRKHLKPLQSHHVREETKHQNLSHLFTESFQRKLMKNARHSQTIEQLK